VSRTGKATENPDWRENRPFPVARAGETSPGFGTWSGLGRPFTFI